MTRILKAALAGLLASASLVAAQSAATSTAAGLGPIQTLDCYDSLGTNSDDDAVNDTFQSSGECQKTCVAKGAKVMITTSGTTCYCGDALPPASAKVDSSQCDVDCGGYDLQKCGGVGYYQFYLTGLGAPKIDSAASSSSSTSSATTSATSAANTAPAVSASPSADDNSSGGGGSSKVGIAVGVVVGIVALAAIVGGGVFFYKRRRRQQLEEEHRRSAAINGFVSGSKSETSTANDSRLDPSIYSHSRQSIGSIADERDFSRRILQVSCPADRKTAQTDTTQVRNPDRDSRASHV
jgi:cell wall integrity and stress response component